jgi:hypothetical protein
MSHLDEGTLHALLDGEIPSAALPAVEQHLTQCEACQARLAEARQFRDEAFGLIEALDATPALAESAAGVVHFAAAPARALQPQLESVGSSAPTRRRVGPRWGRQLALAAIVILAVGLGFTLGNFNDRPADAGLARVEPSAASPAEATAPAPAPPASPTDPRPGSSRLEREDGGSPSGRTPAKPAPQRLQSQADSSPEERRETKAAEALASARADKDAAKTEQPSKKAADEAPATVKEVAAAPPPETRAAPEANRVLGKSAFRQRAGDTTLRTRLAGGEADLQRMMVGSAGVSRVSAETAIKALGGAIKLVEGLTADRYERIGPVVRVVYRTPFGDVVLAQWRDDSVLAHRLLAPPTVPDDSVSAWLQRIR